MAEYLTSKAVERATNLSGSYLRKLVREGVVKPEQDSTGRYLYTSDDILAINRHRKSRQVIR